MTDALFQIGDPFTELVSAARIAEIYGVDIRSVQNWDEKGWIKRKERGMYVAGEVIRGVYDAQRELINKKKGPELPDGMESMDAADRRKKIAEANLRELEEQEKRKDLLPADEVKKELFDIARRTRDAIENIPARIAAILAAETNEHTIKEKLMAELKQALEGLSQ